MSDNSNIEWTDSTWNPITGCTKISPGCKYCYAERLSTRLRLMGAANYENGFELTLHESVLEKPLSWRRSRRIFVNSMSDLFHEAVPIEYIQRVFAVMSSAHWHQFQILTKRSDRLRELSFSLNWPRNVWMGVSVENMDYTFRIDDLTATNAKIKFLSLEPLLGPIPHLELDCIDWVIVGGESGPKSRPVELDWVRNIKKQCETQNVAFFFKQWGGINKKKNGRLLDGRTWDEMPLFPTTV